MGCWHHQCSLDVGGSESVTADVLDHIYCTAGYFSNFLKPLLSSVGAGIDLENIVYYKDNTHYFVMTAKKQSLLDKGVVINVSEMRVARLSSGSL